MKRFLVLITILAFVVAVPLASMAAGVKCCADGKVTEVADKAACDKAKGKVVKDAADCKPAPAKK